MSDTATVDLFGSVHVATADMYPLHPEVEKRFARAKTLVLEIDIDPETEARSQRLLMEAALLPQGERLQDRLDAETWSMLTTQLDQHGVSAAAVQRFRPWFVSLMVLLQQLERAGFETELGLDRYFSDRAGPDKERRSLETPEEQIALLSQLSTEAEVQDLQHTLLQDAAMEFRRIASEWKVGKADLILKSLAEMRQQYPDAYAQVFSERNRRMTDDVEAMLGTTGHYFVVVGAGHLVGPDGMVELLRLRGFSVKQL